MRIPYPRKPTGLQIPASLGSLSRLEVLDLSGNSFRGGIPSELESLKQLRFLSASNNQLGGDLPSFLGSMSSLRRLALDGNKFAGSVPPELGMLNDLRRLYLERNHLVGHARAIAGRRGLRAWSSIVSSATARACVFVCVSIVTSYRAVTPA